MLSAADAHLLVAFATAVKRGSISAAATELKAPLNEIKGRIKQLEIRLGKPVLQRKTRRLEITETGAALLPTASQLEQQFSYLSSQLDQPNRDPSGVLRVSTTNELAAHFVAPMVGRFNQAHPRIRVEVTSEETQPEKLNGKVDVAIRFGAFDDSRFIVHKICELEELIVTNSLSLEHFDSATRPRQLVGAPWVRHSQLTPKTLQFQGPRGATDSFTPLVLAATNSRASMLNMLLHGAGIGLMPEHLVREHLYKRNLIRLCPGWTGNRTTLIAVTPATGKKRHPIDAFLWSLKNKFAEECARWSWPTYLERLGHPGFELP